ncbi:MAG TPA: hypothetical protein PLH27_07235, partial [bacterium]|nr:hypothetical protein [bacterium]
MRILRVYILASAVLLGTLFAQEEEEKSARDTLRLRDLPWAEKELQSIASVVKSELYLRDDATE